MVNLGSLDVVRARLATVATLSAGLRTLLTAIAAMLLPAGAGAEPWIAPGDVALRGDLATLADSGALRVPVTTWPLAWADIDAELRAIDAADLDGYTLNAYRRLLSRAEAEAGTARMTGYARLAVAEHPWVIRTFADTPREDAQLTGGFTLTSDRFTVRVNATRAWDPADGDTFRPDGSYLGVDLGNWTLSLGYPERWWGPGWDGSLILSTNARPIPQASISRTRSTPFSARWLRWVGPWSLTSFVGRLDDERVVDDALLFGLRVSFKPLPGLEVGLSRTAQFCGDDRPCDIDAFGDVLLGRDNRGVNVAEEDEPGNQLAGFDVRWAPFRSGIAAFYLQWIGEDSRQGGPQIGSWLRQVGVELAGMPGRRWHHRMNLEVAETICREGGFGLSDAKPRCAYEHSIYRTGYRYEGRSIGHGMDGDGRSYSVGSTLSSNDEQVWRFSMRHVEINRTDSWFNTGHTISPTPQELSEIALLHARPLAFGKLRAAVGYSKLDDRLTDSRERSAFGWLEFVVERWGGQ